MSDLSPSEMTFEVAATWVPIERLRPWPHNPRKNAKAIDEVARSIKRFGFGSPIVAPTHPRLRLGPPLRRGGGGGGVQWRHPPPRGRQAPRARPRAGSVPPAGPRRCTPPRRRRQQIG